MITNSEKAYEMALSRLDNLDIVDYNKLRLFLNEIPLYRKISDDSYKYSPVYYAFTGRRGAWIYKNKIIICWHPNLSNILLIYPPISKEIKSIDFMLLKELLIQLPKSQDITIQLCRINELEVQELKETNILSNLIYIEEKVLDWKYPVYLLNTNEVSLLRGKQFQQVRQRLNNLEVSNCRIETLAIRKHMIEIISLLKEWGMQFTYDNYSLDDLVSPSKTLLDFFNKEFFNLHGQTIYYKNKLKAFCIWEENNDSPANEFAIASDKNICGLSEFQMHSMCKELKLRNINYINIGGSETDGLNRFKKKFNPYKTYNLKSFIYTLAKNKLI